MWTNRRCLKKSLLRKLTYFDQKKVGTELNQFFANISPKLAKQSKNAFESYSDKIYVTTQHKSVSINDLKDAFFSLKLNKTPEYDAISFNIINKCFSDLCEPLKYIFNLSIQTLVFKLQLLAVIASVSPVYNAGDNSDLTNDRPIYGLPCFFKIL